MKLKRFGIGVARGFYLVRVRSIAFIACLIGIATLLSFPFNSAHDFHQHFRTERVRRSVISHTFVAVSKEAPSKPACRLSFHPFDLDLVPPTKELTRTFSVSIPPVIPAHILLLFRLRPSRAGCEDPFISSL